MKAHPFFKHIAAAALILVAVCLPTLSCGGGKGGEGDGRVVNVTGVSLDKTTLELGVNEEQWLVATVMPSNATNQNVTWSSDRPSVASVINGRVTGVSEGTARITATTDNAGRTAYCNVYVRNISVTGVSLKPITSIIVGSTETLIPTILPSNATNKNVSWQSSSPGIASVDANGIVRALARGSANITVTTQDGSKTAICAVTVLAPEDVVHVTGVTLNKTGLTLYTGSTGNFDTLVAEVQPSNATVKTVTWSTTNPNVASVTPSGQVAAAAQVTAIATGSATIIVTTNEGSKTATCAVNVLPVAVPVTGVTLNKTSLTLSVNQSETLIPTIQPSNATNQGVSWSSSNTIVATVNGSGLVAAVGPGTATITATTQDGNKTATCALNVPTPPADAYVAGYQYATINGSSTYRATLWKNGTAQTLSTGTSQANSVFVSGNDVYVAGYQYATINGSTQDRATLWKNGTAQTLSSNESYAYDVFVSGSDVYVAGGNGGRATLWKNGVAQTLSSSTSSQANSVFVSGNDVYVAGYRYESIDGYYHGWATLWKNGWAETLSSNARYATQANSVLVSGNDVYVAGYSNAEYGGYTRERATLWKNGVAQILSINTSSYASSDSYAYDIFVFGNDVYVAGKVGSTGTLWKNGTAQTTSYGSVANSVFVFGSDVYVAGQLSSGATLWKNSQSLTLSTSGTAKSVFIK